ncbi:alanine/ornithine racemase family PLP-dependent enzyme [Alkaliphilus pronyensis]|uniref:Alanine/ornithine racemase family PLP-dependent enzyme n=1 Tax=Alkaliphilus pronyensis TaxID=1482732 RepID=A0A6I0FDH8_9FIRM|nr:ornithine racemase Orr [Alkaliphilus pronyensis]KAB3537306.1 alanine/ornithine racemase family PLP-dependent enzyme [Alkaliphilus pronyensis]
MNPRIDINLAKLKYNSNLIVEKANRFSIDVAAVTKGFCGNPVIAEAIAEGGVKYLADSRLENLLKMQHIKLEKILLRLPMLSQVKEVVKYADISLNSELETIVALNEAAKEQNKTHKIILMLDLGDLREGIFDEKELDAVIKYLLKLNNIDLVGIGTNLTCFGGVIPTKENLGELINSAKRVEETMGKPLDIISGGNSSSFYLINNSEIPPEVNHLRFGEAILLGTESTYGRDIPEAYQDTFKLVAEIIEIKTKPSVPIGEIGRDAFGNVPTFEDKGLMKRAILAVGKQDISTHTIIPCDKEAEVLGGSSDHLLMDLTHCKKDYRVGDEMIFNLTYGSMLALMTSEYVHKNYINSIE